MTSDGANGNEEGHFPELEEGPRAGSRPGSPEDRESSECRRPKSDPLAAGQMLARYEVVGPLGRGGMGEVYRARDTKLEREVALKVLPAALVGDREHLSRFQREAKLLASLNHPNVATIHGIEQVEGVDFLVLELVPGDTLRRRLDRGPMPIEDAVRVAKQIAAGLEAAHATGIVHRDLKPGNVIVCPDGTAKILDFGLAKRTEFTGQSEEGLTRAFQVLGTPGYLSPEQARGEAADERADVWAFGCILYECLTGRRAFPGKTIAEGIRAMLEGRLDLDALPTETPSTLRLLVSRCLAKDSASRLRAMGDVKLLLENALDESSKEFEAIRGRARNRARVAYLAAGAVGVATVAFLLAQSLGNGGSSSAAMHTLALPFATELGWRETSANLSKLGRGSPLLALSPDGKRVVYCAKSGEQSALYVHVAGNPEPRELPGTQKARSPFFAPDSDTVGFLEHDTIQIISVRAGSPLPVHKLAEPAPNFSACFSSDGKTICYATRKGLRRVSRNGSHDEELTSPDPERDEIEHLGPTALPGGKHLLFTVATGTKTSIALLSLETMEWKTLVPSGGTVRYANGYVIYGIGDGLCRARFDADTGELGISGPVREGVFSTPCAGGGSAVTHFDVAPDGTLAYAPATRRETRSAVFWVDRDSEGVGTRILDEFGDWKHPRIAPDGASFSVDILAKSGAKDVFLYRIGQGLAGNLTHDGMSINSAWHPTEGATVRSTHRGVLRLAGKPLFAEIPGTLYADSWTSDGKTLICTQHKGRRSSLWRWERGTPAPVPLFTDDKDNDERFAQVSPNSSWLAYVSTVQEKPEVFVRRYPSLDGREMVSSGGGGAPVWAKEGSELFYRRPDGAMVAVTFEAEPRFRVRRKILFTNDYDADPAGHQHYDVSKDGRFLMIKNEIYAPDQVHVVPDELLRRR